MPSKKFWEFKAKDNGRAGELFLYGEIAGESWYSDDVTPAMFQRELAALGEIDSLDVYINSPGGDAFAGITIYNILHRHKAEVTVTIDGLAASAASIVAMAGDVIRMPENATMMIHNAWTFAAGNAEELRHTADELEQLDQQMAGLYAARAGISEEEAAALMEAETWMDGKAAQEMGFADEVVENKKAAACADREKWFKNYKHPPKEEDHTEPPEGGILMPEDGPVEMKAEEQGERSEPVSDNPALEEQRKTFLRIRKKLLEV